MTPMQPTDYSPERVTYPVLVQPFIAGTRVLYQDGQFQGTTDMETTALILQDIFHPKVILDGIVRDNVFYVYDKVSASIPFKERFDSFVQVLRDAIGYSNDIRTIPVRKMFMDQQADDQFSVWLNEGHDGMIYRLGKCLYTRPTDKNPENRSKHLLLRKKV
jgi:hypothetical protein